jgi:simple sugar transport system ATP-binding protein
MKALSLISIYKSFDSNTVLKDITLTFEEGQVTAILGDNGAGKSTLLKSLSGLVMPTSGQIIFNDLDITGLSIYERRKIGIEVVYQDYALFKNHSVLANLFAERELSSSLGFLDNKKMKQIASDLFAELNLDVSLLDKYPRMLSGGQQQAVAIARAILFKPKVILLDEPTAALGAKEVRRTLDLIKEQKKQGKIIILVSHRFQDVFEVADRLVILKNGLVFSDRLVAESSIEGVVQEIVS